MRVKVIIWLPLLLGVSVVLIFARASILTGLGALLASAADPDGRPADAIVPLGGSSPFRAMEAAALFHQKLAAQILVPRPFGGPHTGEMQALGLTVGGPQEMVFHTLQRLHVPHAAITLISDASVNTEDELKSVGRHVLAANYRRVILVTSWYHARRVRLIWNMRFGEAPAAAVHSLSLEFASREGAVPSDWWRSKHGRQLVFHEYLGILAFFLRHPFALIST